MGLENKEVERRVLRAWEVVQGEGPGTGNEKKLEGNIIRISILSSNSLA